MMMGTSYIFNYYLYIFLEIIDNKKLKESDGINDDVYHTC
jgi:hypothetical protein